MSPASLAGSVAERGAVRGWAPSRLDGEKAPALDGPSAQFAAMPSMLAPRGTGTVWRKTSEPSPSTL